MIKNFRTFNSPEESFELYKQLMPFVIDIRGKKIEGEIDMVSAKKVKLNYYELGDTLWIHILSDRPAYEEMTEYDFYIRYDQENLDEIIGFKILDFSHFVSHVDEKGILPKIDSLFDVPELYLKSITLKGLIEKAYVEFVLNREPEKSKIADRP